MKKNKIGMIMAVVLSVAVLNGCAGKSAMPNQETSAEKEITDTSQPTMEQSEQAANRSSDDEITLTLWHAGTSETMRECMDNAIARYNEVYPNVRVEVAVMENDPYKTKLATAMAAGQEPDIFASWGGGWLESFVDEGKVLNIDERIGAIEDEYYESALSLVEIKGTRYALPYSCGPSLVYYNKQIYRELGLEIPETIREFEENCDKIKESGLIPIALGNASQWPGALTFIYLSLREGGRDAFLNAYNREAGGTFEDESFRKAGERIQEWVQKGYYPEGSNAINYDTGGSRMLFYGGMAAHIVQTNGMFANCRAEAPEFYDNNLGIFSFPEIEGGKGSTKEMLGGMNALSISTSCEYPEEAFALIHMLTDKVYGQDSVDIAGVITGAKGVTMPNELTQQADELIRSAEYIQNYYDQFLPADMGALHKQTTYDLFGLTTTPEKAAADMENLAKTSLMK